MRVIHRLLGVAGVLAAAIVLAPSSTAATPDERTTSEPDQAIPSSAADEEAAIVGVLLAHHAPLADALAIADEDIAVKATAEVRSCVTAKYSNPLGPYQNVKVTNGCAAKQRVKVVWAYATDSACHSLAPGASWTDHHLNQFGSDRWDGLKSC